MQTLLSLFVKSYGVITFPNDLFLNLLHSAISGNFSIRFCRQCMPLFASIAAIFTLLLTSDRKCSRWLFLQDFHNNLVYFGNSVCQHICLNYTNDTVCRIITTFTFALSYAL